ncbi:MAG: glycosyltransferase [Planctomycetota bacterium]
MDDTMHILMVAYPFPPRLWVSGASIRLVKFLKYMAGLRPSWRIDVLTAGYGPQEPALPLRAADLLADVPESVRVVRVDDPTYLSPRRSPMVAGVKLGRRAVAKGLNYVWPAMAHRVRPPRGETTTPEPDAQVTWNAAALAWVNVHAARSHYDLVYASSPPYSTAVLGERIARGLDIPLVVDVKDNWITARGRHDPARRRREDRMERQVIQTASRILCVTPAGLEHYRRCYPQRADEFTLITNGVDLADYADVDAMAPARRRFKLTYAGSLGGANRSPVKLFEVFARLLSRGDVRADDCEMSFPEAMHPDFWRAVERLGLTGRVLPTPMLPLADFKRNLISSEALVSINYRGETTLTPGKLYEYWAVGRPVFLIETPGVATDLVRTHGLGRAVDADDDEAIYRALRAFYDDWRRGGAPAVDREPLAAFSRASLTERLCEVFERVAGRVGSAAAG